MNDPLMEQALAEAYASCPSSIVVLDTLAINHPSFLDGPILLVNDYADLTAALETGEVVTFTRFAFKAVRPAVNAEGVTEVIVTIDNASGEIARLLVAASASIYPLVTTIRNYRSDDLSKPSGRLIPGEIRNVSLDEQTCELRIGFGQIANQAFPSQLFTPQRFPGLVR